MNASIQLPGQPEVHVHENGITNISYSTSELIYCVEFEQFDSVKALNQIWNSSYRVYEYDSKFQRNCINTPNAVFGGDTITTDEVAGIVNFKNEQNNQVSTGYYHITTNWRLSMELAILNPKISLEERRHLRDGFFILGQTKVLYETLSKQMNNGMEIYGVDHKWR